MGRGTGRTRAQVRTKPPPPEGNCESTERDFDGATITMAWIVPDRGPPRLTSRPATMTIEPEPNATRWAPVYAITVAWGVLTIALLWVFTAAFAY